LDFQENVFRKVRKIHLSGAGSSGAKKVCFEDLNINRYRISYIIGFGWSWRLEGAHSSLHMSAAKVVFSHKRTPVLSLGRIYVFYFLFCLRGALPPRPPLIWPGGVRDSWIHSIRYKKYIKCIFKTFHQIQQLY